MFAYLKPFHLGLDIHADEIRLVALRKKGRSWRLERFARKALPRGAISDGRIRQFDQVQAVLNELVKSTRTDRCRAALALPANSVITKRIRLAAALTPRECEIEMAANLHKHIPGMADELCFDFTLMPATDKSHHDILLVASRKEQMRAYVALAETAGLKVSKVDVDVFALMRAGNFMLPSAGTIAVLDIAADLTQFIVFEHQQIIYSQHWQTLSADRQEAQVQRAIQLCLSANPERQINYLLLAGEKIPLSLDMEVIDANPFQHLHVAPHIDRCRLDAVAAKFLIACGLVLRSVDHA